MSDPTRPSPDPFGGLDPEVWRILAEQDAAAAGGGTGAADPTAVARPAPGGGASSAEVDERYVQKQLGHASAEMTRRYQRRRDRFRVNLTKASGL